MCLMCISLAQLFAHCSHYAGSGCLCDDSEGNNGGGSSDNTDLITRTGTQPRTLWYFLSDLGDNKVILGYPWFAAAQLKINWAQG